MNITKNANFMLSAEKRKKKKKKIISAALSVLRMMLRSLESKELQHMLKIEHV